MSLSGLPPADLSRRRWIIWVQRLLGAVILIVGANLLTLSSLRLLALGLLLTTAGVVAIVRSFVASATAAALFRKRKEIGLAIAATLFFVALTVLVSATIRMPSTRMAGNSRYDADLGWTGNTDDSTIGQRQMKIDPGKKHILFVGDSVLYGHGLEEQDTFALHLNQERYTTFQVLNGAVSGYSTDQYLITLERELQRLKPQVTVVGIFAGNDFQITARDYGWGHSKPMFMLQDDQLVRVTGDLTRDNCIDHLAQSALFGVLWSRRDFAQAALDLFCQTRQLGEIEAAAVQQRLLRRIKEVVEARGSRLLFLLLPDINDFPNVGDDYYLRYISRYRDLRAMIAQVSDELMENILPLARTKLDPHELYLDSAHLNGRGHRVMADALYEELRWRYGIEG